MRVPPLLPQDRYIAQMLGLTEDQMRYFKAEVERQAREHPPQGPVAGVGLAAIAINLIIGIGLTYVSSLLAPRPSQPKRPGQVTTNRVEGESLNRPDLLTSTYGFEAVQDIAPLGEPIPQVFAKREIIDGKWYGGVRVNTPLLWSQVWSLGGSQLLKAIFLLSEGVIERIDPYGFAIGNNTLGAYSFNSSARRVTIYQAPDGGRLDTGDFLTGGSAARDVGAQGGYSGDIYRVDVSSNDLQPWFSGSYKPSVSARFGLYAPIANGLGYRPNPQIRPYRQIGPDTSGENYLARDDPAAKAQAWKQKYIYSCKTGIINAKGSSTPGDGVVAVPGDIITLRLDAEADFFVNGNIGKIRFDGSNTSNWTSGSQPGDETLLDVSGAVAGRQKQYDAALVEGELYRLGSVLAILTDRTDGPFISRADYGPSATTSSQVRRITATFEVVRGGDVRIAGEPMITTKFLGSTINRPRDQSIWSANTVTSNTSTSTTPPSLSGGNIGRRHYTATNFPQVFRCAIGNVVLNRKARVFEIGIVSQVGIRISGICNFGDIPSEGDPQAPVPPTTGSTTGTYQIRAFDGPTFSTSTNFIGNTNTPYFRTGSFVVNTFRYSGSTGGTGAQLRITTTALPGAPDPTWSYITSVTLENGGSGYTDGAIVRVPTSEFSKFVHPTYLSSSSGYVFEASLKVSAGSPGSPGSPGGAEPGYKVINDRAADAVSGRSIEDNVTVSIYNSGITSTTEKRYSFFRIYARDSRSDSDTSWVTTQNYVFGVAGAQPNVKIFNFLRFAMLREAMWEVRFEPISGWEIRNQPLNLIILQSDNSPGIATGVVNIPGLGALYFKGSTLPRQRSEFVIGSLQPPVEFGMGWTDFNSNTNDTQGSGSYLDQWARVAEMFVYDEVTTSVDAGPEHEIAYVNVFQENAQAPQYDNMALVGLNIRASQEWQQLTQFSAYVTAGMKVNRLIGGVEASHLFPEILWHWLLEPRYGLGDQITEAMLDRNTFSDAAVWCKNEHLFFDGVKVAGQNWREWAADVAASCCLLFIEIGGQFILEKGIVDSPVQISGMFTPANCVSIDFTSADAESRVPVAISVRYREENYGDDLTTAPYGLFPTPHEVLVSLNAWSNYKEIESIDLSDYCTSREHAVKAARYALIRRYHADHTVRIRTTYEALSSSLRPGQYIQVVVDKIAYTDGVSGFVDGQGRIQSTAPIQPGEDHQVFAWGGDNEQPVQLTTMPVNPDGTTTMRNAVFTLARSQTDVRTYQVDSIQPIEDGFEINAVHNPVLPDGRLRTSVTWRDDAAWTEID